MNESKTIGRLSSEILFLLEIIVVFISQLSQRYRWGSPEKDIESRLFVCWDELEIYTTFLELLAFH